MHVAKLFSVCSLGKIPDNLLPFVNFKARMDGIELSEDETIIIFQIEGTQSYHPFFLKNATIHSILDDLRKIDAEPDPESRRRLEALFGQKI
jgi:hypothetical protein